MGSPPAPVPGPPPTTYNTGPQTTAPPYGAPVSSGSNPPGRDKTNLAWVMAVIGFFSCGLGAVAGVYFGNEAKKQGDPMGQTAIIVNVVVIVVGLMCGGFFLLASLADTGTTTSGF